VVPLSCTAQFALETGRFVGTADQQALQQQALSNAQRAVSPLARPAKIDSGRIAVVAGASDRVTGLPHAKRLAAHFNSELITFHGGHLLQFGLRDAMLSAFATVTR
jgi:predicted alpha/beta hydrolase family esterase